jgi:pimeloyl-ACP methyl ester carboxylesterase
MLARNDWVASGRTIEFGASATPHRIFVREAGRPRGAAILFLHGFPSSSWDWSKVEPLLATGYRLGYVDFLGFGASSKPKHHRYSLMEQARVAQAAIAALGFDRFHVVAHDYGVSVAQQLLCEPKMRSRIASLTFLNGGLYATLQRPALFQTLLRSPAGPIVSRLLTKERFVAAFASLFAVRHRPTRAEVEQHWEAVASNGGLRPAHRLLRFIDERMEYGPMWESALESSEVPLNFVWGMLDPVAGSGMIEYAIPRQRRFPNVTTLPDVGHYPHWEAPDRVAASIAAFADFTSGGRLSAVLTSG